MQQRAPFSALFLFLFREDPEGQSVVSSARADVLEKKRARGEQIDQGRRFAILWRRMDLADWQWIRITTQKH